jgi:flagellar L-ring protein precursor FlgH
MTTRQPSRLHASVLCAAVASACLGGCGVSHIDGYEPKRRTYQSGVELKSFGDRPANGSLYTRASQTSYLFADQRAMREGDILRVNVVEDARAERGASTELSRESNNQLSIASFLGLMKVLGPGLDEDILNAAQKTDFAGSGQTSRQDSVRAIVPAMVKQVLPNGTLFIEGHRVILVNDEEHHFYVSGLIRPVDIMDDNSVDSARIADAEIEFTGRGVVSEKQRPGWLQRGLDIITPF